MVNIAAFCPVCALKNGRVCVSAAVKPSAVAGGVSSSGNIGDQPGRMLRAGASLAEDPEVVMGKERARELQL